MQLVADLLVLSFTYMLKRWRSIAISELFQPLYYVDLTTSDHCSVFEGQQSLVSDAPFPLKFALKVTHPRLSNTTISTNIRS